MDAQSLDERVGRWLLAQQASVGAVAIDGKCVRNAPLHPFAAFVHGAQSVVSQMAIPDKTNELPCTAKLLGDVPVDGVVVTADARHTQSATVHHLVQDHGVDYVIGAHANQPTVLDQCHRLLPQPDFPPRTHRH